MDCQTARELYVAGLLSSSPASEEATQHGAACEVCREEFRGLAATWAALGELGPIAPSPEADGRIRRRLQLEAARGTLGSLAAWQRAALVGVVGFVVSLGLSLVVPYDTMVELCRELGSALVPEPGAYLAAGFLYGLVPMVVGVSLLRKHRAVTTVLGALEATAVFLVVLLPYVVALCGSFPLAFLVGFLGGITVGAVGGSLTGVWVSRWPLAPEGRP
jgi:hypothetical protein